MPIKRPSEHRVHIHIVCTYRRTDRNIFPAHCRRLQACAAAEYELRRQNVRGRATCYVSVCVSPFRLPGLWLRPRPGAASANGDGHRGNGKSTSLNPPGCSYRRRTVGWSACGQAGCRKGSLVVTNSFITRRFRASSRSSLCQQVSWLPFFQLQSGVSTDK